MLMIVIGYNAYNLCLSTKKRIQSKGTSLVINNDRLPTKPKND